VVNLIKKQIFGIIQNDSGNIFVLQ